MKNIELRGINRKFCKWWSTKNKKSSGGVYLSWHYIDFGSIRLRISGLSDKQIEKIIIEELPSEGRETWGLRIKK